MIPTWKLKLKFLVGTWDFIIHYVGGLFLLFQGSGYLYLGDDGMHFGPGKKNIVFI